MMDHDLAAFAWDCEEEDLEGSQRLHRALQGQVLPGGGATSLMGMVRAHGPSSDQFPSNKVPADGLGGGAVQVFGGMGHGPNPGPCLVWQPAGFLQGFTGVQTSSVVNGGHFVKFGNVGVENVETPPTVKTEQQPLRYYEEDVRPRLRAYASSSTRSQTTESLPSSSSGISRSGSLEEFHEADVPSEGPGPKRKRKRRVAATKSCHKKNQSNRFRWDCESHKVFIQAVFLLGLNETTVDDLSFFVGGYLHHVQANALLAHWATSLRALQHGPDQDNLHESATNILISCLQKVQNSALNQSKADGWTGKSLIQYHYYPFQFHPSDQDSEILPKQLIAAIFEVGLRLARPKLVCNLIFVVEPAMKDSLIPSHVKSRLQKYRDNCLPTKTAFWNHYGVTL